MTREVIWRWVTPRWRKHLEQLVERERPDAVVVFTVPMAHLRGIPTALRERFGIPVVFYDGDVPMSLPEFGGMDTGFNWYHDADPSEYDLLSRTRRAALDRLRELGARRAEAVFWGADPEFFAPHAGRQGARRLLLRLRRQVPARLDARRWSASRRGALPDVDFALGGRDFQGDIGARAADRRRPVQHVRARDLVRARQPLHHAPLARHRVRVVVVPAVRARLVRRGDRLEPVRGDRALVRARLGAARRRRRRRGRRRLPRAARRSRRRPRSWAAARASACSTSTPTATARASCSTCSGIGGRGVRSASRSSRPTTRSGTSARVIDELRAFDPGSTSSSSPTARSTARPRSPREHGAHVLRLPFNLGIGGAVQTGFRYAWENGYELAVRCDGDGQHDPAELPQGARAGARGRGRHLRRLALRRRRRLSLVGDAAGRHPPARAASSRRSPASASPTRPPASRR